MKNKVKQFFHSCISFVRKEITLFREDKHRFEEYKQNQRVSQNKQFVKRIIYEMMHRMTGDLFEAFHGHNYGLTPINIATGIRIRDYRLRNGRYEYLFDIDKVSSDILPQWKQRAIVTNMNRDIARIQQELHSMYSLSEIRFRFPFLSHGLAVTEISDMGFSEVTITVVSGLSPDVFYKMFFQPDYII